MCTELNDNIKESINKIPAILEGPVIPLEYIKMSEGKLNDTEVNTINKDGK